MLLRGFWHRLSFGTWDYEIIYKVTLLGMWHLVGNTCQFRKKILHGILNIEGCWDHFSEDRIDWNSARRLVLDCFPLFWYWFYWKQEPLENSENIILLLPTLPLTPDLVNVPNIRVLALVKWRSTVNTGQRPGQAGNAGLQGDQSSFCRTVSSEQRGKT